jgi:GGDEF domain-containing protein
MLARSIAARPRVRRPSIGLALFDPDADDMDRLIIKADLAMYSGKRQGSCGWAVYRDGMQVPIEASAPGA